MFLLGQKNELKELIVFRSISIKNFFNFNFLLSILTIHGDNA